jgi:hypothetical protein
LSFDSQPDTINIYQGDSNMIDKYEYKEDIKLVADTLSAVMFSDSHAQLDMKILLAAIEIDFRFSNKLPTYEECEVLVCGDDDGNIPEELRSTYSTIDRVLCTPFI